jgi:hypothetical protein
MAEINAIQEQERGKRQVVMAEQQETIRLLDDIESKLLANNSI